ncbi:MAG: hypothetical protein A3K03_08450 [Bdellovibrionales bacterium RIFOXYD1_FULL_44_7]|nr:MAG: hypothetical protein A3K03_08450 [Bdellovibrionales bacterium RIFOXYD1_FULL_44_7]
MADKTKSGVFTVDTEQTGSEVPTITKLLNRKSFINSRTSASSEQTKMTGTLFRRTSEISGQTAVPSKPPIPPARTTNEKSFMTQTLSTQTPNVKPVLRKAERRSSKRLIKWEIDQLKSATDMIRKTAAGFFAASAEAVLFLPADTDKTNGLKFIATAGCGPRETLALWTGIKFDPVIMPGVWKSVLSIGAIEVANVAESRVFREVFGAQETDRVTVFRIGPASEVSGIIVVISKNSLANLIQTSTAIFSSFRLGSDNAA